SHSYHLRPLLFFLLHCPPHHRYLHSFPTRRSSDLGRNPMLGQIDPPDIHTQRARDFLHRPLLDDVEIKDLIVLRQWPVQKVARRSEEHTSELQSRFDLVCRLLLEKKKKKKKIREKK